MISPPGNYHNLELLFSTRISNICVATYNYINFVKLLYQQNESTRFNFRSISDRSESASTTHLITAKRNPNQLTTILSKSWNHDNCPNNLDNLSWFFGMGSSALHDLPQLEFSRSNGATAQGACGLTASGTCFCRSHFVQWPVNLLLVRSRCRLHRGIKQVIKVIMNEMDHYEICRLHRFDLVMIFQRSSILLKMILLEIVFGICSQYFIIKNKNNEQWPDILCWMFS